MDRVFEWAQLPTGWGEQKNLNTPATNIYEVFDQPRTKSTPQGPAPPRAQSRNESYRGPQREADQQRAEDMVRDEDGFRGLLSDVDHGGSSQEVVRAGAVRSQLGVA
jgi:hypothetical protein